MLDSIEYASTGLSTKDIPRAQNIWTHEQRVILCLLVTYYGNSRKEKAKVFSCMFEDELQRLGFSDGLPERTFEAQWRDMDKKNRLSLRRINSELSLEIDIFNARIESMESTVGFQLSRKDTRITHVRWPNPRNNDIQPGPSNNTNIPDHTPQPQPRVNTSSAPLLNQPPNLPPTPPASPQHKRRTPRPKLLFRAWNAESNGVNSRDHFAAGLWAKNPGNFPRARQTDWRIFDTHLVKAHFDQEHKDSPFISLFSTPLAAVHRAVHTRPACITIVDPSRFDKETLFSATDLLRGNPVSKSATKAKYGYAGWGEWVVWGEIDKSKTVATVSTDALERTAAQDSEIGRLLQLDVLKAFECNRWQMKSRLRAKQNPVNEQSGITLGRLCAMLHIPESYAEPVALRIVATWEFAKTGREEGPFIRGVRSAYPANSAFPQLDILAFRQAEDSIRNVTEIEDCRASDDAPVENYGDSGDEGTDGEYEYEDEDADYNEEDGHAMFLLEEGAATNTAAGRLKQGPSIGDTSAQVSDKYFDQFALDRARVNRVMGW